VETAADDVYTAAFLARCDAMRSSGQPAVRGPGVHGLLGASADARVRLLVTDDRAHDVLMGVLPEARGGTINVLATAGWGAFGEEATVIFVNTQPDWRGRAIGRAMTAAALRSALHGGARRASLDASYAGARIYRRLGFDVVSATTSFFHTG